MDAQLIVYIILGILVIAASAAAYLSGRTWYVPHIILVFSIFLFALAYTYLAAKVLKIEQTYRQRIVSLEVELERLETENRVLQVGESAVGGAESKPGIRQVRQSLYNLTSVRGGVWRAVQPVGFDAAAGQVRLKFPEGVVASIPADSVVFAFEDGPAVSAGYLGEFRVTGVDSGEGAVVLQPVRALTEREQTRVAASKATWSLYKVMPVDQHEMLRAMDEAELRAVLPPGSVDEYIKDGKPAAEDDPEERTLGRLAGGPFTAIELLRQQGQLEQVVERIYSRSLRDYEYLFRELDRQRALDEDSAAQLTRDAEQLQRSLQQSQRDIAYREEEKTRLAEDLKRFETERDLIARYYRVVDTQYQNLARALSDVEARNAELSATLASLQLQSAERIGIEPEVLSP